MHDYINKYHDQVDWTETWDQNEVACKASLLIDKILINIHESKLEIHEKFYHSLADKAARSNVFGSPSYVLNDEVFWGQDRLDLLEERILDSI